MSAHVGRAGAYGALPWFRQRPHMAGRQREDKMFQTRASISPRLGEALSLSSEGVGGGGREWDRRRRRMVIIQC